MESLHQLFLIRHSIRRYTDQPVAADDVKTIIEAALLSPSSKSARPWQFVVVEDKNTLEQLSQCKTHGTVPVKGCAFAVVVTADPGRSDVYVEDSTLAAIMMHLQAADLGIGSCWIQVRGRSDATGEDSEQVVRELLDIPSHMAVECIVTFGYSAENRRPVDPAKLLWEKVHIGKWTTPAAE